MRVQKARLYLIHHILVTANRKLFLFAISLPSTTYYEYVLIQYSPLTVIFLHLCIETIVSQEGGFPLSCWNESKVS